MSNFESRIYSNMVQPRNASTVVLLRPADHGDFEILLTRRPPQMKFLGGYYVFPGGTVHRDDYSSEVLERCRGLSANDARRILGTDDNANQALGHWVAVVRELFEEVGVLLCLTESGGEVDLRNPGAKDRIELKRQAMVKSELDFGAFLKSENLICDLSRAVYFDHWVTPEIYSMRFDTRFYIAKLPSYQIPLAASEEVIDSLWVSPQDALSRINQHDFPLLPPTTTVLAELGRIGSWQGLQNRFHLI
jgi:8-oxo-dGTP pyrophosphatase MutT (NUDIX family)